MTGRAPRVDAHLHVWDLARGGYGWLTPDLGELYATFLPARARAEMHPCGVHVAVLVQAEDSARETQFLLDAADSHPWVAGVVGWVRLDDPETAERQLDAWQAHPRLCGVRHLVHDDPRADFLSLAGVRESLDLLAERRLVFDVPDAWPRHLHAVAELAAALPGLSVVVDHLAKPPFGGTDWPQWRDGLAAVAALPNVTAKLSGLHVGGVAPGPDDLRAAWEVALELFGPQRLMWGSDWPMTVPGEGYRRTWERTTALLDGLGAADRDAVLGGTAVRVYRLGAGALRNG